MERSLYVRFGYMILLFSLWAGPATATDPKPRPTWCPATCWYGSRCLTLEEDICHDYNDRGHTGVFRGTYRHGFETSQFLPEGSKCRYWLSGELAPVDVELRERWPYLVATVNIEVEGTVTAPGCYGHMQVSPRELKVAKVRSFKVVEVIAVPTLAPNQ